MKLTLSWLRDHLDTTASVAEIADALTDLGLEVEDIHDPAMEGVSVTVTEVRLSPVRCHSSRMRESRNTS